MVMLIQLYVLALMALGFVSLKIAKTYRELRYRPPADNWSGDEAQPISICIPARNETNAMTECLESVLASDYPKMEVIVLDDNSSDNTSHLIKAFAHAGVRFIEGKSPPRGWLGKNYSLQRLLNEASGRYVIFMDVDTRIKPTTISRLMTEVDGGQRPQMISVLPQRYDLERPSAWLSTLRCFWDLIFHNQRQPSAYSAIWLINRRLLKDRLSGFKPWSDQIQPELGIAGAVAKINNCKIIMSTPELGVSYAKKWSSQVDTARRALLPRFSNSVARIFIAIGMMVAVILPQIISIVGLVIGWQNEFWLAIALSVLALVLFVLYCNLVWSKRWWIAILVAPVVAWQEIWLMLSSVIGYWQGTITWKGRQIIRPSRSRRI